MTHPPANDDKPLAVERLRALLRYNPFTGRFYWRVNRSNVKAGNVAGKLASNGYWKIKIDGVDYTGQQLAWLYYHGTPPAGVVDHRNRDTLDNRIANLRDATFAQNQYNRTAQANNTSGFKGVSLIKKTGRYRADIKANGVPRYLGSFATAEEASAAYDAAARDLHGEFARNSSGPIAANDNRREVEKCA